MRILLGAAALVLLAAPAGADDKTPKTYQVPYKLTSTNHVMVRVKLNGKGPFNFIVDTGAPALFVATKVARKAGAEVEKDGMGVFESLELEGGLKMEKVPAMIADPFQLEGMNSLGIAGVELHGMIGYSLLARYKITYDFTSDKLGLTELPGFTPKETPRFGKGGQGGLELIGSAMKMLAPLLGFKGPPVRKPRGYLGLELDDSANVKAVLPDSPADKAGFKAGDKLVKFAGDDVEKLNALADLAAKRSAGDEVTLTVERGGSEKKITLKLGKGL